MNLNLDIDLHIEVQLEDYYVYSELKTNGFTGYIFHGPLTAVKLEGYIFRVHLFTITCRWPQNHYHDGLQLNLANLMPFSSLIV